MKNQKGKLFSTFISSYKDFLIKAFVADLFELQHGCVIEAWKNLQ